MDMTVNGSPTLWSCSRRQAVMAAVDLAAKTAPKTVELRASGDEIWCPADGGAGPQVAAGGIGGREESGGGGVGDGGGGGGDGGCGGGGGGGAEEPSERLGEGGGTTPSTRCE